MEYQENLIYYNGNNKSDVFTPDDISSLMASFLQHHGDLLEPCVGTGNLLKFTDLKNMNSVHIFDINENYLNKCPSCSNIKKYHTDFITSDKIDSMSFNNILLNPPFIRIQDMMPSYRSIIKQKWKDILNSGNIDIYYAFLLKCLELLAPDGVMVSITPNSFLYTKSATKLRRHIFQNCYVQEIIDFQSKKIFKNVSTYCCITIFSKTPKTSLVYNDTAILYSNINHVNNTDHHLFYQPIDPSMTVRASTKTLGDIAIIANGIATLRDKIYIHNTPLYPKEPCWHPITNGFNVMYVIYPYTRMIDSKQIKIIDESTFQINNPRTYEYLLSNKHELAERDKGNKSYPSWYAFGRTQSLQIPATGKCIYIPTLCDSKNIKGNVMNTMLHISSIRIYSTDPNYSLSDILEIITHHNLFVANRSSKRSGGWINISPRVLKQIPI